MDILAKTKGLIKSGKTLTKFTFMKIFGEIAFLGIPLILARIISPDQFGSYTLSMMVVYLLTSVFMYSFKTPFIKYANEDLKETGKINKTFSVLLVFWLVALALFFAAIFIFKSPIIRFASLDTSQYIFLVFALMGISLRVLIDGLFLALNRRLENARFWFFMGMVAVIFMSIAYFTWGISSATVFTIFLLAPVIVFPFVFRKEDYNKLRPFVWDKKYAKKILSFGSWIALGGAAVYLLNWGDNIILRNELSVEDVGIYNLGYQFFKGAIIFTALINGYFLPFLARNLGNPKKLSDYLYKKRPILFCLGLFGIIGGAIVLVPSIRSFYSSEYYLSGSVVYILFIGLIFSWYKQFYEPLFYALNRYKFIQITYIALVVFNLALDYFLVVRWQSILGAAVATMLTYILIAIVFEVYYHLYCKKEIGKSIGN